MESAHVETDGQCPCLLCGYQCAPVLFAAGTRTRDIMRCVRCRLIFRRDPYDSAFGDEYYEKKDYGHLSPSWVDGRKAVFAPSLVRLEPHRQTNRLLDIGAGHGFFLAACQDLNWEVSGVEISQLAADFAAEVFGLSLERRPLEEVGYEDHFFDVVTLWNVLEILKEALRILRPGGVLVLRVPNAAFQVPARRFFCSLGPLRKYDVTVFHLYSLSRSTISSLLEQVGFVQVRIEVAPLVWTSKHGTDDHPAKQVVSKTVQGLAHLCSLFTRSRLILSPSLLVGATKPLTESATHPDP